MKKWNNIFVLLMAVAILILGCSKSSQEGDVKTLSWDAIEKQAKGQTVYFSAWAGSDSINQYIQWATDQYKKTIWHCPKTHSE